jgi:hypothetical protein
MSGFRQQTTLTDHSQVRFPQTPFSRHASLLNLFPEADFATRVPFLLLQRGPKNSELEQAA